MSKLTREAVLDILIRTGGSESYRRIGRDYGVSAVTVFNIRHRRTWRWLEIGKGKGDVDERH
jgi:hypothetical protein